MFEIPLADRMNLIDASGIRKVFDLAANMKDPINLSIGQPDFDIAEPVKQAAIDAIQAGRNGYTVTQGIEPLRDAYVQRCRQQYNWTPGGVLVTSGVSGGLVLAMMCTVQAGDEVIIIDPYFVMYSHLVNLAGATPVLVSSYPDFSLPLDRIADAITPRTKIIMVNSPTNPTGCVYEEQQLQDLAELARKHNLLILSDEIYRDLSYDAPVPSIVPFAPERTLLLDGLSKSHAMTGWRLGFAAGPKALIEQMAKLQQFSFVCAPSMVQHAAVAAMNESIEHHVTTYRAKRDLVVEMMQDRFKIVRPAGGFYIFPEAPGRSGTEFCKEAISRGVLIIPGNVFSSQDTHFRISYAAGDDTIRRGLTILNDLADSFGS